MSCIYKYKGKDYTKEEFYSLVRNTMVQPKTVQKYEKVLFPTGNTASKVEGHTTLEEFKKQKEDRLKQIIEDSKDIKERFITLKDAQGIAFEKYSPQWIKYSDLLQKKSEEITQLKLELERVEIEGFGALKPIYNFYENTVTNILKKNYTVNKITDEYGNTWNEYTLSDKDLQTIPLKAIAEEFYGKQSDDYQLMHKIAEDFERYKNMSDIEREKDKTILQSIKDFFDKIIRWINDVFFNENKIDRLYRKIDSGKFAKRSLQVRQQFEKFRQQETMSPAFKLQEKFKAAEVALRTKSITMTWVAKFNKAIADNANNKDFKIENIKPYEIFENIRNGYKLTSNDLRISLTIRNQALAVYNSFDLFEKNSIEALSNFGIKIKKISDKDKIEISEQEVEFRDDIDVEDYMYELGNTTKTYGQEMVSIPGLKSASTRLRLFLSGIPVLNTITGKSQSDDLGRTVYHDFYKLYYYLEKRLAGLDDFSDMIKEMQGLSVYRPELETVIYKLMNKTDLYNTDEKLESLQSDFKSNFSKQQLRFIKAIHEKKGEGIEVLVIDSNRGTVERELVEEWKNNLNDIAKSTISKVDEKGEIIIDKEKAKIVLDKWTEFKKLPKVDPNNKVEFKKRISTLYNILAAVGVELSPLTLEKNMGQPVFNGSVTTILTNYVKGEVYESSLLSLAKEELSSRQDAYSVAFKTIEKEQAYSIQFPSYISKTVAILKGDKIKSEGWIYDKMTDPLFKSSNYLNMFLNDEGIRSKFAVGYVEGLEGRFSIKGGKKATKMRERDTMITRLSLWINEVEYKQGFGWYSFITPAEKELQPIIKLPKIGVLTTPEGTLDERSEILDSFYKVFQGVYNKAKIGLKVIKAYEEGLIDKSQLVRNYHFKDVDEKGNPIIKDEQGNYTGQVLKTNVFNTIDVKDYLDSKEDYNNPNSKGALEIKKLLKEELDAHLQEQYSKFLEEKIITLKEGKFVNNLIPLNSYHLRNESFTTQDWRIKQLIADYSLNSYLANIEFGNIFLGDGSFYKEGDLLKRAYEAQSMTTSGNTEANQKIQFLVLKDEKKYKSEFFEVFKKILGNKSSAEAYNGINIADAMSFLHPIEWKRILNERGLWNPKLDEVFEKAERRENVTEELRGLISAIKPFYFGFRVIKYNIRGEEFTLHIPTQIKTAALPLFKSFTTNNPLLAELRDKMDKGNTRNPIIQQAGFESTVKVGQGVVGDILNLKDADSAVIELDAQFYGNQVDNPDHTFEDTNSGLRQTKMLIGSALTADMKFSENRNGDDVRAENDNLEAINVQEDLARTLKDMNSLDKRRMLSVLQAEFTRAKVPDNIKALFTLDSNNDFVYPLDIGPYSPQIQSIINSVFSKAVIKQGFKGGSATQMSSIGLGGVIDLETIKENSKLLKLSKSFLKFINPIYDENKKTESGEKVIKHVEAAECMISVIHKDLIGADGLIKDIKNLPEELRKLIIYRIPTEGYHSMLPLKIVGFLPMEYGNTILLPYEIVAQMGSDFDLDKTPFIRPEYYKDNQDNLIKHQYLNKNNSTIKDRVDAILKFDKDKVLSLLEENTLEEEALNLFSKLKEAKTDIYESHQAIKEIRDENSELIDKINKLKEQRTNSNYKIKQEIDLEIFLLQGELMQQTKEFDKFLQENVEIVNSIGKIIETSLKDKTIEEQNTKVARNNRLFDNYTEILLHPEILQHIINPSNFEKITKYAEKIEQEKGEGVVHNFYTTLAQEEIKRRNHTGIALIAMAANHVTGIAAQIQLKSQLAPDYFTLFDNKRKASFTTDFNEDGESSVKTASSVAGAIIDDMKNPKMAILNINEATVGVLMTVIGLNNNSETALAFNTQPSLFEFAKMQDENFGEIQDKDYKYRTIDDIVRDYKSKILALEKIDKEGYKTSLDTFDNDYRGNYIHNLNVEDLERNRNLGYNTDNLTDIQKADFYLYQLYVLNNFKKYSIISKDLSICNSLFKINNGISNNYEGILQVEKLWDKVNQDAFTIVGPQNMQDSYKSMYAYMNAHKEAGKFLAKHFPYNTNLFNDIKNSISSKLFNDDRKMTPELRTDIDMLLNGFLMRKMPFFNISREEEELLLKGKKVTSKDGKVSWAKDKDGKQLRSISAKVRWLQSKDSSVKDNPAIKLLQVIPSKSVKSIEYLKLKGSKLEPSIKQSFTEGLQELVHNPNPGIAQVGKDLIKYFFVTSAFHSAVGAAHDLISLDYLNEIGLVDFKKQQKSKLDAGEFIIDPIESERFITTLIRNKPQILSTFISNSFDVVRENKKELPKRISVNPESYKLLQDNRLKWVNKDGVVTFAEAIRVFDKDSSSFGTYFLDTNSTNSASYYLVSPLGRKGWYFETSMDEDIVQSLTGITKPSIEEESNLQANQESKEEDPFTATTEEEDVNTNTTTEDPFTATEEENLSFLKGTSEEESWLNDREEEGLDNIQCKM